MSKPSEIIAACLAKNPTGLFFDVEIEDVFGNETTLQWIGVEWAIHRKWHEDALVYTDSLAVVKFSQLSPIILHSLLSALSLCHEHKSREWVISSKNLKDIRKGYPLLVENMEIVWEQHPSEQEGGETERMVAAVKKFLSATGHDLCHENRRELAAAFGLPCEDFPKLPPENEFAERCVRYRQGLYGPDGPGTDAEVYEEKIGDLKQLVRVLYACLMDGKPLCLGKELGDLLNEVLRD